MREFPYRFRDIILAIFLLVMVSPIMLLVMILIKLTMPGPIFFLQQRVGRNGKLFRIYKFRSMIVNHDRKGITLSKDQRITPLGRVLRKYKIDEFPQLINILKGDMSFVGPRPDLPGYYDTLKGEIRDLLSLSPGLTGLDSVFYPFEEELMSNISDPVTYYKTVLWPHKVRINYWYYKHRSHWLDLKIMLNTASLLLFRKRIFSLPEIP